MAEHRLFDLADPPAWLDPEWWRDREHCDHLGSPTGAHVARLKAAAELAAKTADRFGGPTPEYLGRIVDLGAGDGALLSLLPPEYCEDSRAWGYDIIREDVRYARDVRGQEVHLRNVQRAFTDGGLVLAEVIVLTEVLEHMADPHAFLTQLHARDEVRYVVASSPHGETSDQHEWNHAWVWDADGYRAMFEAAGFETHCFERVEWSQLWLFEAVR